MIKIRNTSEKKRRFIILIGLELLFLFALIATDLFTKWAVENALGGVGGSFAVFPDIIEFTYVRNYGASFGAFEGQQIFLLVLTCSVSIIGLAFLYILPSTNRFMRYSILMIVGGAIGNIVDRAAFGYVRDFIDYKFLDTWFGIDFAIGNVADLYCIVGVLMFIVYAIFVHEDGDVMRHIRGLKSRRAGSKNAAR